MPAESNLRRGDGPASPDRPTVTGRHDRRPRRPGEPTQAAEPLGSGVSLRREVRAGLIFALTDEQLTSSSRSSTRATRHVYGVRALLPGRLPRSRSGSPPTSSTSTPLGIVATSGPQPRGLRGRADGSGGPDHEPKGSIRSPASRGGRQEEAGSRRWPSDPQPEAYARHAPPRERLGPRAGREGRAALARDQHATGRPTNHNWHVGQRGVSRSLLAELATATSR